MFRSASLACAVLGLSLAGCTPTCDELCTKLTTTCGLVPAVNQPECVISCDRQLGPLVNDTDVDDDEQDQASLDEFNVHRTCIGKATCDELAAGACFDAALFPYSRNP